jgi:7-cyano-7-deazaguanine synthase
VRIVLTYSGGLDSTTLLYHLRQEGHELRCLGVDYGQRHRKELAAAAGICDEIGLQYRVADLRAIRPLLGGSALTDDVLVPHGHYEAETMKATVVPNRNMIMLSVAIGWAVCLRYDAVAYAAHGGRPEFADAIDRAARLCDWHAVQLLRPFVDKTKADLVRMGAALGVPFEKTWSCYQGGELHCGKCGTCVERREAFERAGVPDPTIYEQPRVKAPNG